MKFEIMRMLSCKSDHLLKLTTYCLGVILSLTFINHNWWGCLSSSAGGGNAVWAIHWSGTFYMQRNIIHFNSVMKSHLPWLTNFNFSGRGHSCTIPSTNVYTKTTHIHILGQINCIMESWLMIVFYSGCINSSTRVHHSNNKILWCPGFAWLKYL